mgnify:CR=1 FL=1
MRQLDSRDRAILRRVQGDLPAGRQPFDAWARELGIAPDELLESPMLTADQLAAVMWGNACRLYGVEPVFAEVPDAGVADEEALT